jgi:hypothetical protein
MPANLAEQWTVSQRVSKLAERPWSDASGLFLWQKTDFPGDFQKPNLTKWENSGYSIFELH